jgi:UDP-glucose 4-epimerase
MDLVYVEDAARAFLLAAGADAPGAVVNIASGVETTLDALARTLLAAMGASLPVEYGPERSVSSIPRRLGDTRRAREAIGFEARVDLETGLRHLVEWWRAVSAHA